MLTDNLGLFSHLLDLDMENSRQSPQGYHSDKVCTPTGVWQSSAGFWQHILR